MTPWFATPPGVDEAPWREAVREVSLLIGDTEALEWIRGRELFWGLMQRAGLIVGSPKPADDDRAALHAELDAFLGV